MHDDYGPATYGDSFADVYDQWYEGVSDVSATVEQIIGLAGSGPVLELGVGSGRLAAPLAARGVSVIGIDASRSMLDQMPPCDVAAIEADMAALPLRPGADLTVVFVAFNTIFNLTSAAAQQACFTTVAGLLAPGASFFVEAFVPHFGAAPPETDASPASVRADGVVMTSSTIDAAAQQIVGEHLEYADGQVIRRRPWQLRYATPEQLDAMAATAGLALAERWSDWSGAAFNRSSDNHVSRYTPA